MMILYRTSIIPASHSRISLMNLGKYYQGGQHTSQSRDFFHKERSNFVEKMLVSDKKIGLCAIHTLQR